MQATFTTKSGKTFTGKVLWRGFYSVDALECYEIQIGEYTTKMVPVTECEPI